MLRTGTFVGLILMIVLLFSCGGELRESDHRIKVFVSILPQKFFVEKIGGEYVNVSVMVSPGQSPATYEPTPKQMGKLSETRLFFAIGVAFEEIWLKRIADINPSMTIIHTEKDLERKPMDRGSGHHNHSHEGMMDPHIWLSPRLVMMQSVAIYSSLSKAMPEHEKYFSKRKNVFLSELHDTDTKIRKILETIENKAFLVFHPSWGYYADEYGLLQMAIEYEGKGPTAQYLGMIIDKAKANGIKTIFVQEQFSKAFAGSIAKSIGANVVAIDPLSEDYINNLIKVALAFREHQSKP